MYDVRSIHITVTSVICQTDEGIFDHVALLFQELVIKNFEVNRSEQC